LGRERDDLAREISRALTVALAFTPAPAPGVVLGCTGNWPL
jgi:hypothetical protein